MALYCRVAARVDPAHHPGPHRPAARSKVPAGPRDDAIPLGGLWRGSGLLSAVVDSLRRAAFVLRLLEGGERPG
eukprot:6611863-Prymnesium_polylepis.1